LGATGNFREHVMIEVEPSSVEEDPSAARTPVRHDFSVVRGFQVVAAEDHGTAQQGSGEAWRDALKAELEARAARFHQAVDAAIVLSNDGIIRWLGDPVARLALGPNALTPGAVILADEALPASSQEIVKNRVDLWLAATARRLLGPLFVLQTLQEGSAVVRDLAGKLARSLGILEREPIRREIKALAQDDRAELRKHGVRFGAYYIFAPALIKPAPRNLALHLWGLQAPPPGDADGLMRVLRPLASSGRTSLLFDGEISREGYRIAGYRPCGERIVRVDVVERLAGIIRTAMVGGSEGVAARPPGQQKSKGFVVTGQMTSLTGCSGEQFASILRSMGFESVQMKRSDFFGSPSVCESTKEREPLAPAELPGLTAHDQTTATPPGGEGTSVEGVVVVSGIESPAEGVLEDVSSPDMTAEDSCSDASAAERGAESGESSEGERNDEAIVAREEGASVEDVVVVSGIESAAEGVLEDVSPRDVTADASRSDASAAEPGAESGASSEVARNDEAIVVWRPERRAPTHRGAGRRAQRDRSELHPGEHSRVGAPGRSDNVSRSPAPAPKRMRNKNRSEAPSAIAAADARKAAERPPPQPDQSDKVGGDKKHRQAGTSRDMSGSHPGPGQQPRAKVDPNSPFAKLLELRSLLEGQANKRP
jgi:ATP-dependent RNA helicase SUPV3L1/SUV3